MSGLRRYLTLKRDVQTENDAYLSLTDTEAILRLGLLLIVSIKR